jgi:hypothetical protein
MTTTNKSGVNGQLHNELTNIVEKMNLDTTVENVELCSKAVGDLILNNYKGTARNTVRTKIIKFLKEELNGIQNFPTLEYKGKLNLYPISYLYSRDDLSMPGPGQKILGEKNLKFEKREAIDCQFVIDLATKKLYSDRWEDVMIGLAILTGRREVEIAYNSQFNEYDRNILLVTGLLKKRETDDEKTTFRIPCLIESSEIIVAFERFRTMVHYKFQRYRELPIDQSEPLFNGNECKQLSTFLKTDDLTIYLKNLMGESFTFRDYRTVYGSILNQYSLTITNGDYADTYTKTAMGHVSADSTIHYKKYNFTNFPNFPSKMFNLDTIGKMVADSEPVLFELKFSELARYLTPIEINSLQNLDIAKLVKLGLDVHNNELKKTGSAPVNVQPIYIMKNQNQEDVTKIIDCMIRYNDGCKNKRETVAFSVKTVLEIYFKIFKRKIMELTISKELGLLQTEINLQIEKYGSNWGQKNVGGKTFFTNKHLGNNLYATIDKIVEIYRELNVL